MSKMFWKPLWRTKFIRIYQLVCCAAALLIITPCAAAQTVPPPRITKDKTGKPNWIDKPDEAYPRAYYISASGYGSSRQQADANALGNLTSHFGQSVKSRVDALENYREQLKDNIRTANTQIDATQDVVIASSLNQLIGAEINDRWEDRERHLFYSAAIMEKPKTVQLYEDLIDANLAQIQKIVTIPELEKSGIIGVARYEQAARFADENEVFSVMLAVLGGSKRQFTMGSEYRQKALELARQIPISIVVTNDADGGLAAAFADVFAEAGFSSGSARTRYVLNAKITVTESPSNNNEEKYARYVLEVKLTDTKENRVVLPYSTIGREGHLTQKAAVNRAYRAAQEEIRSEFAAKFNEFLEGRL
ncbi:MAG: LPP20 family lipoprotein [Spirochaetaceae bacterium]|jgi:hypothetical protein|nr:LPP20 family lipoprotein [Spirochaetaceae bacterium]